MILQNIKEATVSGARLSEACKYFEISPRTIQRWKKCPESGEDQRRGPKTLSGNQLTSKEKKKVLKIVNSPEFRDISPNQIVPALADQGVYLASESTMYRILRKEKLNTHRSSSRPPKNKKPREYIAEKPNAVWSWDITYLKGPVRGTFYYLYMIMDIWSRKIVGWEVYSVESDFYASLLMDMACQKEGVRKDTLTVHQDNGSPMKGATLKATFDRLGVTPSYSRPHVSDDNAFSESLFRNLKYRPEYPTKPFQSIEAARNWVTHFVSWYNTEHKHSAIRYVTPKQRHNCEDKQILDYRHEVYEAAKKEHPERWTGKTRNWNFIQKVYLNPEDLENCVTKKRSVVRKEAC